VKLVSKSRSLDDIDILSDNEVLNVQRQSENVKALENIEYSNGHHKRHSSSGDVSKTLRESSSKSSLRSFDLSDRSFSLNSLTSDTVDSQMVDQEDILTLTAHVRHFSDALSKLRNVIPGSGSDTDSDGKIMK
jgi:E3 ubiquitin-protein ligase DOA10